jgi:hypothetical protein
VKTNVKSASVTGPQKAIWRPAEQKTREYMLLIHSGISECSATVCTRNPHFTKAVQASGNSIRGGWSQSSCVPRMLAVQSKAGPRQRGDYACTAWWPHGGWDQPQSSTDHSFLLIEVERKVWEGGTCTGGEFTGMRPLTAAVVPQVCPLSSPGFLCELEMDQRKHLRGKGPNGL